MTPAPRGVQRADPITRVIADRVAQLRRESGLNQGELGERMAQIRPGWSRSTVAKLENYNREAVSVGDLLALAQVLDVPPVLLIADPRTMTEVPVAADLTLEVWRALGWLMGNRRIGGSDLNNYATGAALTNVARDVQEGLLELRAATSAESELIEREGLMRLAVAINVIATTGAAWPPELDLDEVYRRAREAGVFVPGIDWDPERGPGGAPDIDAGPAS